jgi:hypothetical protein
MIKKPSSFWVYLWHQRGAEIQEGYSKYGSEIKIGLGLISRGQSLALGRS